MICQNYAICDFSKEYSCIRCTHCNYCFCAGCFREESSDHIRGTLCLKGYIKLLYLSLLPYAAILFINRSFLICFFVFQALYTFIFMFHMPLFAFVSGRFTKNVRDARDNGFDIIIAGAGGVCALVAWYSRQPAFRNVFAVCKFLMTAPAA